MRRSARWGSAASADKPSFPRAVLICYTYAGYANLDGKVNALDFNALAASFGSGTEWFRGDFNFDGGVTSADFTVLSSNFGQMLSPAPALGSLVPEPGLLGLLTFGCLLQRRRR